MRSKIFRNMALLVLPPPRPLHTAFQTIPTAGVGSTPLGAFKQTSLLFHSIWSGRSAGTVAYPIQKQNTNDGGCPKFILLVFVH